MTQQLINIGTTPGDSTGDAARMAFDKCNQNFTELYTTGAGTTTEGVWNFNQTSTDTTTSPATGRFRTNSGNAATATQFAIHRISINGFDRADTLRTQAVGDIIKLQDKTDADTWARFIVQATPVDNVDWFQIDVAFDSGGGTAPGNNQEILFTFAASSGGGGGGGITDAPSDGVRYVRQNAGWVSGDAAYATPAQVALKADIASPTFTGDPKAPTPATADNDTSIATTAFVKAQGYLTGNQTVTLSGDVTGAGTTAIAATIANNAVTNAKLADMATARLRGRVTTGIGDPEDLTGTQATTLLDVVTSSLKGLAPASGGGTTNFLRADGTWTAPSGAPTLPTQQIFTSGSGTYTTPANCRRIEVTAVGGGGGGSGTTTGSTNGTAGGNTTFGTFTAGGGGGGGSAATTGAGGIGGVASGTGITDSVSGGGGGAAGAASNGNNGGVGGNSTRGGGAPSPSFNATTGINAATNSGGGGSGASGGTSFSGAGGGAGATVWAFINTPAATYSYTVGGGGGGGTGGTFVGGAGAAGIIIVKEFY